MRKQNETTTSNQKFEMITLSGTAYYAKVHKPDPGNPAYNILPHFSVDLIPDEESLVLIKKHGIDTRTPTESVPGVHVRCKMNAFRKDSTPMFPKVVDSELNPIPPTVLIGNGSKVRIRGPVIPYKMGKQQGVSMKMNVCQVVELVEYKNKTEGIEKVTGGFVVKPKTLDDIPEDDFGLPPARG